MALPNPALTFEQSSLETAASSSAADVLTAIEAAFADLSTNQWTTSRAKGEDASNPAIRITAPSGSPISDFNAILGAPATSGSGFKRASYRDYTQTAAVDSSATGGNFWLAIGPDGYDNATAPTNWYNAINAFGTSNRESGFWCGTYNSSTNSAITKVWVVASAETCAICFRYGTDNICGFLYFGAIVEGVNAANVESDDRLYGMCTSGNDSTPWPTNWSYTCTLQNSQSLAHSATGNFSHAGLFDPTSAGAASFPATIAPRGAGTGGGQNIQATLAFNGGLTIVPLQSWRGRFIGGTTQAPYYAGYCGRLRGIYWTSRGAARSILLDTSLNVKGYRMSGSLTPGALYDAVVFYNEG